ncbi:MAG: hypothetical protein COA96_15055 [SAR86 cluster bacterium]|uniref:Uncharacterized protein n=1 Tax=SAR86 cluster bacterium TaxID=2030880 RepID=A0A2A5ARV7_9GAMM|nr:MAG: hypothetical protein COA96_15055 [SAR86 cluster bacterium]
MQRDTSKIREYFKSLSPEEVEEINSKNEIQHKEQVEAFLEFYGSDACYLCGKPFKAISKNEPCLHWLLRRCKFRKKDFPKIYENFSYGNIEAFLRWCANQERHMGNINDLIEEKSDRKVISTTIKWKNIEWTFDCSNNDYSGHKGTRHEYPHYHFQMRIDGRPFISFGDFHIPFTEDDLFNLDLKQEQSDWFKHNYGATGSGMQDAMDIQPEDLLEQMIMADEEDGTYNLQTIVEAKNGVIPGDILQECINEQKRSGKTMAAIMKEKLSGVADVKTIISPADSVPEIAKRTERKRR